jgi:hypothetical protein
MGVWEEISNWSSLVLSTGLVSYWSVYILMNSESSAIYLAPLMELTGLVCLGNWVYNITELIESGTEVSLFLLKYHSFVDFFQIMLNFFFLVYITVQAVLFDATNFTSTDTTHYIFTEWTQRDGMIAQIVAILVIAWQWEAYSVLLHVDYLKYGVE